MTFKDYFSNQSAQYEAFRPHYPQQLFTYLAEQTKSHRRAWDCATGNGQAALGLTQYFDHVIATDLSEKQLESAVNHEQINYVCCSAESTQFSHHYVDLITVAQALHWFHQERFFTEAKRVLKPGGILAIWCYGLHQIEPNIDQIIYHFYTDVVGPYWPIERKHIEERYENIEFPFKPVTSPSFTMRHEWNLDQLIGYLTTWSAVEKFKQANHANPIDSIINDLSIAWGTANRYKHIHWPLYLKLGRA